MSHSQQYTSVLGAPINRVDGKKKVTGQARYASEQMANKKPYVGWIVESCVAKGTLTQISTSQAEEQDGVKCILTYLNAPKQRPFGEPEEEGRFTQSRAVLESPHIRHYGMPVALVIAETLEQARFAASLVRFKVIPDKMDLFYAKGDASEKPDSLDGGFEPDAERGDIRASKSTSTHTMSASYSTPLQISAAMEPHATVADFDGSHLEIYTSVQIVSSAVSALANTLCLEKDKIHVKSPYIGGGFGSKLGLHYDGVLASLAAIKLEHPVKVVLSRRQVFYNSPHRGNSYQDIALGCSEQGNILAIEHHSAMPRAKGYNFAEAPGACARVTYASDAIKSTHRVCDIDTPPIDSTRAPGDAIGSLAFESAIDELAISSGLDPLDFRLQNIPETHPLTGDKFTSHKLKQCLQEGAQHFNWYSKPDNGSQTVKRGYGVASAMRINMLTPSEAQVEITKQGKIIIKTDMTDIGTGTYTILAQIAASVFHTDIHNVEVMLGDSDFPASCGSGGSFGASSAGSSVLIACKRVEAEIRKRLPDDFAGHPIKLHEGKVISQDPRQTENSITLTSLISDDSEVISAKGEVGENDTSDNPQYSCGAHFAEVEVDTVTGEIRLCRQLGVFSAGKILNMKTATSQLIGGMVWGAGYALTEALYEDKETGSFINPDLAEYHLPVNRDIAQVDVHFIEEPDFQASPLGSKGIGELGITGAGAAIANAVFDATGVRVREFPITVDKIISAQA